MFFICNNKTQCYWCNWQALTAINCRSINRGAKTSLYSIAESPCSFLHSRNLNTNVKPKNIALHEALYKEALYELSKFILIHTIQQKYAFIASLTNSGANTVHQALYTTPSIFKANNTENIVIVIRLIHISNTVSPIHCTISFSVKNIFTGWHQALLFWISLYGLTMNTSLVNQSLAHQSMAPGHLWKYIYSNYITCCLCVKKNTLHNICK